MNIRMFLPTYFNPTIFILAASVFTTTGCKLLPPTQEDIFDNPSDGYTFDANGGEVKLSMLDTVTVCYSTDGADPEMSNGQCLGSSTQTYQDSIKLECLPDEFNAIEKKVKIIFEWPNLEEPDGPPTLEEREANYQLNCGTPPVTSESVEAKDLFPLLRIDQPGNTDHSTCTGILLRPGLGITAKECLDGNPSIYSALQDEIGLGAFPLIAHQEIFDELGNGTNIALFTLDSKHNPDVEVPLQESCATDQVSMLGRETPSHFVKQTLYDYTGEPTDLTALESGFQGSPGLVGQALATVVLNHSDGSSSLFSVCKHIEPIKSAAQSLGINLEERHPYTGYIVNSASLQTAEEDIQSCDSSCREVISQQASVANRTITSEEYLIYIGEQGLLTNSCRSQSEYHPSNPQPLFSCIEENNDIVMKALWKKYWVPGVRDWCRKHAGIVGSPGQSYNEYKRCLTDRGVNPDPDWWPSEVARHCENSWYITSKYANYNPYWTCYRERGFEFSNDTGWQNGVKNYCKASNGVNKTGYQQCLRERKVNFDSARWLKDVKHHCDNAWYPGGPFGGRFEDYNTYWNCFKEAGTTFVNDATWKNGVRKYCRSSNTFIWFNEAGYRQCLRDRKV